VYTTPQGVGVHNHAREMVDPTAKGGLRPYPNRRPGVHNNARWQVCATTQWASVHSYTAGLVYTTKQGLVYKITEGGYCIQSNMELA
jgi:hypothetical protein